MSPPTLDGSTRPPRPDTVDGARSFATAPDEIGLQANEPSRLSHHGAGGPPRDPRFAHRVLRQKTRHAREMSAARLLAEKRIGDTKSESSKSPLVVSLAEL